MKADEAYILDSDKNFKYICKLPQLVFRSIEINTTKYRPWVFRSIYFNTTVVFRSIYFNTTVVLWSNDSSIDIVLL